MELIAYGELFTADAYAPGFRPWEAGRPPGWPRCARSGQNKTPLVREEILQPMLAAALYLAGTLGPHRDRAAGAGQGRRPEMVP